MLEGKLEADHREPSPVMSEMHSQTLFTFLISFMNAALS